MDKNCLPCTTAPPLIAPKIIKNLYVSFCKAGSKECTEEMLSKPKKKKQAKEAEEKG